MTARQKTLAARPPKLGAFYFPEENTTAIAPLSCVVDGNLSDGEDVRCLWEDEEINAVLVKMSDLNSFLTEALAEYETDEGGSKESQPIDTARPRPDETARPQPIDTAKPQPDETASTQPVEKARPQPVEKARPQPAKHTTTKSTGQKQSKKSAQTIASGTAQRSIEIPANLPGYQLDNDVRDIVKEAGDGKRTTSIQTGNVTVHNSTQTNIDLHTELFQNILTKLENIEKSMNKIDGLEKTVTELKNCVLTSRQPEKPSAETSSLVKSALNALNDPYDFAASEVSFSTPTINGPTHQPTFSNPTRRPKDTVHDLGFWKVLPCEVLSTDTVTILEKARSKTPSDLPPEEVPPAKMEELKASCMAQPNQRAQFSKHLVNSMLTLGELFNRNVNGRNSTGQQKKERINPAKMDYIRDQTFKVFPCLISERKSAWSDCVKAIDKANVYLQGKLDLKPVMDYL